MTRMKPSIWHNEPGHTDTSNKIQTLIETNLDHYSELGAKWNLVIAYQHRDGSDDFKRLKRVIFEHEQRGIEVVLRLIEDPSVYSRLNKSTWTGKGYDKEYFEWVSALASTFKSKIPVMLIGNEVEHNLAVNIPGRRGKEKIYIEYDQYKKLLDTAYLAIKSSDKNIQVADYGPGSSTLGLAVTYDLYQTQGADVAHHYWSTLQRGYDLYSKSKIRFMHFMSKDSTKRKVEFARNTYLNPGKRDLIQLHHYRNPRSLPQILDWIHALMEKSGKPKPIIATEVGFKLPNKKGIRPNGVKGIIPDYTHYSEQEHINSLIKNFTILLSQNTQRIQYWNMRWRHNFGIVASLYEASKNPKELIPRKSARTYQELAKAVNGSSFSTPRLTFNSNFVEYRFVGTSDVSIVWAEKPVVINLSSEPTRIANAIGEDINITGKKINISNNPIFIYWN